MSARFFELANLSQVSCVLQNRRIPKIHRQSRTKHLSRASLIEFDAKKGLFVFVGIKDYLEELLDCEVDLVTKGALHPALKTRILREARRVF